MGSFQLEAYVSGFLTGFNAAFDGPDIIAAAPDDKGVSLYIWIDNLIIAGPNRSMCSRER